MKDQNQSPAGYWMLAALCAILALPPVVGHFMLTPVASAEATPSLHADAAQQ